MFDKYSIYDIFIVSIIFSLTLNSCKQEVRGSHNNASGITSHHEGAKDSDYSVISPRDLEKMNIRRVNISITYKNRKSIEHRNVLKKDYRKLIERLVNDTLVTNIKVTLVVKNKKPIW